MDKELIERLAVEAGMYIEGPTSGQDGLLRADVGDLMRFAELVVAHSGVRKSPKAASDGMAVLGLEGDEQSSAPITALGMSWRVTTMLQDAGIKTVGQAREAHSCGVTLPGFGRKAANELRRAIERLTAGTPLAGT